MLSEEKPPQHEMLLIYCKYMRKMTIDFDLVVLVVVATFRVNNISIRPGLFNV